MSVPDPTRQSGGRIHQPGASEAQPAAWSTMDYAAYGVKTTLWGATKVVQYGILRPLELIGSLAAFAEKTFYGEEESSEPAPLTEKEVKSMGGNEAERESMSAKEKELEALKNKIRELEGQLAGEEAAGSAPRSPAPRSQAGASRRPVAQESEPRSPAEPLQRTGKRIAFSAAEGSEGDEAGSGSISSSPAVSSSSSMEVSDRVVEDFVSPLYDREKDAEVMQELGGILQAKNLGVDLEALLAPPAPVKPANVQAGGGVPPPPPGGPPRAGGAPPPPAGGPPVPGSMAARGVSADAPIMKKFGIDQAQLNERRAVLKDLYEKTNNLIAGYRKDIAEVKQAKANEVPVAKAHNFEDTRKKDLSSLEDYKKDREVAQAKCDALQAHIEAYQALIAQDPQAQSDVVLRFEMQTGKGETKVVDLPIKEVIERNLIVGYRDEVKRMEDNIKNLITSMNTNKRLIGDKLYGEVLKYKSKEQTADGSTEMRDAEIQVAEFLKKEKSLRVAEEKKNQIRDQMKLYGLTVSSEKKVEEVSPDDSALAKEREAAKAAQMKKELAEKISGLKSSNVADFTFTVVKGASPTESQ